MTDLTDKRVATGDWHMESVYEMVKELQQAAKQADSEPMEALFSDAADMALWLLSRLDDAGKENHAVLADYRKQHKRAEAAESSLTVAAGEVATLIENIRWAHYTLYEINPSNYDHGEVCKLNDASVEVILGLAPLLGETHGKTDEWWAARALKGGANV